MNEAVAWLRGQVQGLLEMAQAMACEDWPDHRWAVTECSNEANGDCPCIVYQGEYGPLDQAQIPPIRYIADAETEEIAQWIAVNDPRDAIARCEAELAILNGHAGREHYCPLPVLPSVYGQRWTAAEGPCWTIRLLASGYRHRPGYAEHWEDARSS